jgi:hypothetical protein
MSKRKTSASGAMLDLWRPPQGAGDPIGCLASTYTFDPGLFDEQCLGRFLDIESEPDREDLAFLLERESRLGGVYAGVLVDHTQGGVEHSLRWDVLRVRLRSGKQHSKLSLLAWNHHVRIIVASANLTEFGYRFNQEIAGSVDLTPSDGNVEIFTQATGFLRSLLGLVPGASNRLPEVQRAQSFLDQIERLIGEWNPNRQRQPIRRQLVFTLPSLEPAQPAHSSLEEAIQVCRSRGSSPSTAWIASPFFDVYDESSRVTAALCKFMARGVRRKLAFCVPAIRDSDPSALPRLAAPKSLVLTPLSYQGDVTVEMLPALDGDKNSRPWHAKLVAFHSDHYSALMIGSSNFTCAGMGVDRYRNAEANLLTVVNRVTNKSDAVQLDSVWPEMERVLDPESAEWLGPKRELDEEETAKAPCLPAGFLSATYRAGDERVIILHLDPARLPEEWQIYVTGSGERELLAAGGWRERGSATVVELAWKEVQPPPRLLVRWAEEEAFLSLNVEDSQALPPPAELENMTADDMLLIIAAADPSAAFRAWAKEQQPPEGFDAELDSATPIDLDPLRRYDLQATFLHRVRRRARILAQLRANLERPVYGRLALEWRLRGLLGVEPLADRLGREVVTADGPIDEGVLTLADFLIVLREVKYQPAEGSLSESEFKKEYRPFLGSLAGKLRSLIEPQRHRISEDLIRFWERVLEECHG